MANEPRADGRSPCRPPPKQSKPLRGGASPRSSAGPATAPYLSPKRRWSRRGREWNESTAVAVAPGRPSLPRNVKVSGLASLLNDIASEMIFPLLPNFLLTVLLGNRFYLGIIEGAADSVASLLKLWSGGRSDKAGRRKGFVVFGYSLAA